MFIPKRSPRDEQRERLYAAEHEVAAFQRDKLPTVPEMQRFVDSILGSRWLRTNFAASMAMPITVLNGYGRRMPCADAYQSTIAMPKGGRSQFIVCHEVAHVFCDRCHGDAFPFHGAEFATFELELVSRFWARTIAANCLRLLHGITSCITSTAINCSAGRQFGRLGFACTTELLQKLILIITR